MTAELLAIFLEMAAQMGIARLDRLLAWNQRGAADGRIRNFSGPRLEPAAIRAVAAPRADEPNLSPEQPNELRSQASQP
ncbi:hypothetical protein IMX07_16845 [bacterium]|nr:hypothetical protein [bacterium]